MRRRVKHWTTIDTSKLWPFQSILGLQNCSTLMVLFLFAEKEDDGRFSFSTEEKSGLQDITCGDGVSSELSWWVFFHETQVWWRPSEALRPVHDVVWKLNRLATKTKNTRLVTFGGACDWYHLYLHIYIYTEVSFVDKIHLGNIFCCCSLPIVFWHTIWRGDDFSLNQRLTLNTLLNSC